MGEVIQQDNAAIAHTTPPLLVSVYILSVPQHVEVYVVHVAAAEGSQDATSAMVSRWVHGLAAVAGILRSHAGGVAVRTTPGIGTCVSLYLPATGGIEPGHA